MPPEAMIAPRSEGHEPLVEGEVRTLEETVPLDRCHLECADTGIRQPIDRFVDIEARRAPGPAMSDGHAIADVDGDHDPVRSVGRDEPAGERGVRQGRGPDDRSSGTGPEDVVDGGLVPKPTRDLDLASLADRCHDRRHRLPMDGTPRPSTIKIDDMEPSGARRDERLGDDRRIVAVDRLSREVTLSQPHDPAAPQVDRRQDLEPHCLASIIMLS